MATVKRAHKAAIREYNEKAIIEAAEEVFAEHGFSGATTTEIARRAGVPKANVHYYYATKKDLYRRVLDDILSVWLEAANTFETCDTPVEALTRYIHAKMDMSRARPLGSKIWANEIIHGAPMIQDFLDTTLRDWMRTRAQCFEQWAAQGKIQRLDPHYVFYMIWATTQHYADFNVQVRGILRPQGDAHLDDAARFLTDLYTRALTPDRRD